MIVPDLVRKYAPTLLFSKGERYFPCSLFFAGENIVDNKQEYEKLTRDWKLEGLFSYYHIAEGERYTVYQYWYYYAYNEYALLPGLMRDDHEHDFECLKVFVDKETESPEIITCNIHFFRELTPVSGEVPEIKVERGGHGLFTKNKGWHWRRGLKHQIKPVESCEILREKIMSLAPRLVDKDLKLKGDDYDPLRIGKLAGPQVPWARWEYYLPEETLYGLERKPEMDITARMRAPVKLEEEELKRPLIERTGPILLPQSAQDLQEAVTVGRRYGVVTKKQYRNLRYAGVRLKEEESTKTPS